MSDPRCNCGEPDCPICTAPEHKPWTPKPGQSPDPMLAKIAQLERQNAYLLADRQWHRWQDIRRYLLVMLLALLGGMIGGVSSAFTLLHYLD